MKLARRTTAVAIAVSLAAGLVPGWLTAGASAEEGVYSPGGWSTLHRGPANRKLVPEAELADHYRVWTALEGASVLTAPALSPDGETLYVTTGRARGTSNLHAYGLDGTLRWRSEPWQDGANGVDPCAVLSSPIVDDRGWIFIGDCNQLFAFRADGSLAWQRALPPLREGDWSASESLEVNALTTAAFTREGHVFGVTNMGDVVVFDRATGRPLVEAVRLPGLLPPRATHLEMPESVFGDGLMDPGIRDWAWQLIAGGGMRSANTPAVDLATGRIFVAATSEREGFGALYGLDLVPGPVGDGIGMEGFARVAIAFATEMGLGSGSSPALSPDGRTAYVSDEEGTFYAVSTTDGAIRWRVETKATAAAAAVGEDGTVYALQAHGPALVAIAPDGRIRWESRLGALARAALPDSWLLGAPRATGNGNPTVLRDVVLVPVVYGYETRIGRRIPWPVKSSLVAVDRATGRGLRDVVELVDDSTGITGVLRDGTILNSLGTAITSGTAGLQRLESLLPGDLRLLRARGGLQVSRPVAAAGASAAKAAARIVP